VTQWTLGYPMVRQLPTGYRIAAVRRTDTVPDNWKLILVQGLNRATAVPFSNWGGGCE
jgi:hypothetical protein